MEFRAHAYVGEGGAAALPNVLKWLETENIVNDSDIYARGYAHFGVDDARAVRERAALRAWEGRRAFVIAASVITIEAQNALLKTFEEPPAGALFVLLVPAPQTLLPTLLSRMQPLDLAIGKCDIPISPINADAFLAADMPTRLDMLKAILDADERDVGGAIAFLAACERALAPRVCDTAAREGIEAVYRARSYIADKGALMKPLLEQAALLVPRV